MAFSLTQTSIDLIEQAGYLGLGFGLVIDSAGIPLPSEVLIPLAAVNAFHGKFNIYMVMIVATAAQTLGGYIAYEIGRYGGLPFLHKYGKYFLISKRELDITHRQFEKRGELLAFTGRCIPLIRGYIGFIAGIAEMPLRKFMVATFLGSTAWTLILTAAGYFVSDNVEVIDKAVRPFSYLILAIILILVVVFIRHRLKEHR